jgi:hypothetical protein
MLTALSFNRVQDKRACLMASGSCGTWSMPFEPSLSSPIRRRLGPEPKIAFTTIPRRERGGRLRSRRPTRSYPPSDSLDSALTVQKHSVPHLPLVVTSQSRSADSAFGAAAVSNPPARDSQMCAVFMSARTARHCRVGFGPGQGLRPGQPGRGRPGLLSLNVMGGPAPDP